MALTEAQLAGYDWELVQAKDSRSVYRLSREAATEAYAKVYHPGDIFQKLSNRLLPRSAREAASLRQLAARGLPVPAVLAEFRRGNSSTLVTAAIVPGTPLHDLPTAEQPAIMLKLAVDLLMAGFVHNDLHAGNIVMGPASQAYLIDTYAVRPKRINARDVVAMLAQVASLYQLGRAQLLHALRQLGLEPADALERVTARGHAIGRERARKMTRRCLRASSCTRCVKTPDYTALIFGDQQPDLDEILKRHRQNISAGTRLLKVQDKTQLSVVDGYCVKAYRAAHPATEAYALRAWRGLLTLRFNHLPSAEPVAAIVYNDRSSVLITDYLELRGLDRFLYHDFGQLPVKRRYRLIGLYGQLIGRMHARGIYHADLKACNVLVDPAAEAYYLIDTDRVESRAAVSQEHRLKNLIQINNSIPREVAPPIRMHFIKKYAAETGDDAKRLFAKVWLNSSHKEIVYTTDQGDHCEFWD